MKRPLRLLSLLLGLFSAALGIAISVPSVWSWRLTSYPGIIASEWPWLPFVAGLGAILSGYRARGRRIGSWLGVLGAALSLRPLWHIGTLSRRHTAALRDGFGADYERAIPAAALATMTGSRLGILDSAWTRRFRPRPPIRVTRDVAFHVVAGLTLRADVYQPLTGAAQAHPALISIHGGSWRGGDKGLFFAAHNRWLAVQGYVVLDIQYRLSPDQVWPAQLDDVKTAIRWLRAHAEQYGVDPDRIGLIGRSAGAHLALMAAFTPGDSAFVASDGLPARDDVQAVVAIYPPTDLPLLQSTVHSSLAYWLGSRIDERPDIYVKASPLYAARAGAPPVLMAHGGWDNLVTPDHSARLLRRLRELGVPAAYLDYPWARHGFDFSLIGLGGHMLQYDTDRFLAWALHRKD